MNSDFISYGRIAKFLHWTVAALILLNYFIGLTLDKNSLYNFHKQTGLCILALVIMRVIWRLIDQYPPPIATLTVLERSGAKLGHLALYILMIAVPLSGILMVNAYGYPLVFLGVVHVPPLIEMRASETAHVFAEVHEVLANTMIAIVAVHVLAALKHHFVNKDNVLRRMIPFGKKVK